MQRVQKSWRWPLLAGGAWALLVAMALIATLGSLRDDGFDGLNNMAQIPFALPWWLLPLPATFDWSHETDAWATAGMGWFNAVLVVVIVRLAQRASN
jgi:hypothetical protein